MSSLRLVTSAAAFALLGAAIAVAAPKSSTPPKLTPMTPQEKATATKYAQAMQRGRAATDKKDYVAAVHGFDDALALRPNEPQALAERGYAHLLAGDLDAAQKDMLAAQPHLASAKLAGMNWFNLGLLAEKRHVDAAAKAAFAESNRLHPTKAAAAKLAGAVCTATVSTTRDAGSRFPSWVELQLGLAKVTAGDSPATAPVRLKSEAEAKAALCGGMDGTGTCDGAGPWIVAIRDDSDDAQYSIVFAVGGALVAHTGLGERMGGRCATTDSVEIVKDAAYTHVAVSLEPNDMVEVDTSGADIKPCGANADNCHNACFYDDKSEVDYFYDPATGAEIAAITRPETPRDGVELKVDDDFKQNVSLSRAGDAVVLAGGGCDRKVSLSAAAK